MDFIATVKNARRVSTPLMCVTTADPAATVAEISSAINSAAQKFEWDVIRGIRPVESPANNRALCRKTLEELFPVEVDESDPVTGRRKTKGQMDEEKARQLAGFTGNPAVVLENLPRLPAESLVFLHNVQSYLENPAFVQGIWNLRDVFSGNRRTLVMLCPDVKLPPALAQDVMVIDEALPTDEALSDVVTGTYEAVGLADPDADTLRRAVDALRGLARFPAEQATAMSITPSGVDMEVLWERKRKTIENIRGIEFLRGGVSFDQIGGAAQVKALFEKLFNGRAAPTGVVWIDEIEKLMAGSSGSVQDSSGVSQDQLATMLTEMEDNAWTGLINVGPAGVGKSMLAQAVGKTFGVQTIRFDLGAMQGSLVGESQQYVRAAFKAIKAMFGSGAFFIATCNALEGLPAPLRRRFRRGIWFTDLPNRDERAAIWAINRARYEIPEGDPGVDDTDFVGADIRNTCENAYAMNCTLAEAVQFIVPVAKSDPEAVRKLRQQAHGNFLSVSRPGFYSVEDSEELTPTAPKRRIDLAAAGIGRE